jgi:hypothetical protein
MGNNFLILLIKSVSENKMHSPGKEIDGFHSVMYLISSANTKWQSQKILGQMPYPEFCTIKKPLDIVDFKISPSSRNTLLPLFTLLFETFTETTTHGILQYNLRSHLIPTAVLNWPFIHRK